MTYLTSAIDLPSVSIVVPTRDQYSLLKQCIQGLLHETNYPASSLEIIIINNRTRDKQTLQLMSEWASLGYVRIIDYDAPFNFSSMNNMAVAAAKHEVICLLNNDIEVISPNWLLEMVYFINRQDIGCVGAKLYYPNNTIQHAGVVLGINGIAGHVYKHCPRSTKGHNNHLLHARYYSAVTAACMLIKKVSYLEVGGFDENLAVAYNDVDFCLSLKALGYKHVWTPRAELYHHESVSRGTHKERSRSQKRQFKKEVRYMKKKWHQQLHNDPAWSSAWPLTETWCGCANQ